MSTLSDFEYAKYNAMIHSAEGLSQINFDGVKFLENGSPGILHRCAKWCMRIAMAIWRFLGECFKDFLGDSPASHNARVRRSHYDCPLTRGIY